VVEFPDREEVLVVQRRRVDVDQHLPRVDVGDRHVEQFEVLDGAVFVETHGLHGLAVVCHIRLWRGPAK
jgi:hypothetical protein